MFNRSAPVLKKLPLTAAVDLRVLQRGLHRWLLRVWSSSRTKTLIHQKLECIRDDPSGRLCGAGLDISGNVDIDDVVLLSDENRLRRAFTKLLCHTRPRVNHKRKLVFASAELKKYRMCRLFRELRVGISVKSARYRTIAVQRLLREAYSFICTLRRITWRRSRLLYLQPVAFQKYAFRTLQAYFYKLINYRSKRRIFIYLNGKLGSNHYRNLKLHHALIYWKRYSSLKRKLGRITRRFHLRPALNQWTSCAVASLKGRRIIRLCRVNYFSRVVLNIFLLWRHYTLRCCRLRIHSAVLMNKVDDNIKCRVVYHWMYLIANGRDLARVEEIRETNRIRILNSAFENWVKSFTTHSKFTRQSCKVVFRSWRDYSVNRRYKRECKQYGDWYSDRRLLRKGLYKVLSVQRRKNKIVQYGIDGEACILLFKLRCGLQFWRRWAWWKRRQQLYSRKRPGFDGILGLFSSYSTGLSSCGVSRMSKVYNHLMDSSSRPAPTTPVIPSDYSYVVLRRAVNIMYKFLPP